MLFWCDVNQTYLPVKIWLYKYWIYDAMKLLNSVHFASYFRDYLISSLPRVCRGCFFHLSFPPKKLLKKGSSVVLLTTSILKVTSKDMSCFEIGFTTQVLCLTPLHGKTNSLRSDAANHQIQICYGKKLQEIHLERGLFLNFMNYFVPKDDDGMYPFSQDY